MPMQCRLNEREHAEENGEKQKEVNYCTASKVQRAERVRSTSSPFSPYELSRVSPWNPWMVRARDYGHAPLPSTLRTINPPPEYRVSGQAIHHSLCVFLEL